MRSPAIPTIITAGAGQMPDDNPERREAKSTEAIKDHLGAMVA